MTRYTTTAAAIALLAASAANADRLLTFAAQERVTGTVHVAEVLACDQPIIRLRSELGSVLSRANTVAESLATTTAAGFARPVLTVAPGAEGTAVLMAGERPIVTADAETARLSGMAPWALAAGWQTTIGKALAEPYIALTCGDDVLVPVTEARFVGYGGPLGKSLQASSDAEDIAIVRLIPEERRVKVYAESPGMTLIVLNAGKTELLLAVDCRYWAAKFARSAVAELTGSGQDESLARKVAINAALSCATPREGATLSYASVERAESEFKVTVLARGADFIAAKQAVAVTLKWISPPAAQPVDLKISNDPERIRTEGTLMREPLEIDRPCRLLYHHVNSTGRKIMFVARIANPTGQPASAHVVVAEAGPGKDELGVGHTATRRFIDQRRTGSGYVLRVPPRSASDFVRVACAPDTIVSGLARIVPLAGPSPLYLEVQAESAYDRDAHEWIEPLSSGEYASPKMTAFTFGAGKHEPLTHEVGGSWTFFPLGKEGSTNAAGTYLSGDFGVEHSIDIDITNPTAQEGRVEIVARASGGVMRGFFLIDGVLRETGVLTGSRTEVLEKRTVPPRSDTRIRMTTMPESASNYPVHIIVRSILKD